MDEDMYTLAVFLGSLSATLVSFPALVGGILVAVVPRWRAKWVAVAVSTLLFGGFSYAKMLDAAEYLNIPSPHPVRPFFYMGVAMTLFALVSGGVARLIWGKLENQPNAPF